MEAKIQSKQPLVVHIFMPLCDNENQGMTPVNKPIGNGWNLGTNLYWRAVDRMKSYFKKYGSWKLLSSKLATEGNVLELVIFYKNNVCGTDIYLVIDAYRGD